jgi:hypothetical protein
MQVGPADGASFNANPYLAGARGRIGTLLKD